MAIQLLLLILGLIILLKGADWLVTGASALAKRYGVSDLAIGLTIVAFGTSAPELVVNSFAAARGQSDLVLGNVIGSNNFNLFVILGIAGLIIPLTVQSTTIWKEIPFSLFAVLMFYVLANDLFMISNSGVISRIDALILLLLFCGFIVYVYTQLKRDQATVDGFVNILTARKTLLMIAAGLAGLIIGGRMAVINASAIATSLGVSEKIIGLTIVAAGTSLPELAATVVAALKKNADIAVGNIIGSNVFNIFLILGVSAMIRPVRYDPGFNTELYLLAGGTLFLFVAMFTGRSKRLDRWEALILFLAFVVYSAFLIRAAT